ncbi:MAG: hypothetical protein V4651_05160 [Bacteroidota bacterium]
MIQSRMLKRVSLFLAINMLYEIFFPTAVYALTGGPSQSEVQSFEPVSTTQMVDPFTGDFNYNIPLLDVDGYPINIAYHSGVTMDQEASWVGLGWNLNPGAVNRNMRGLPDDFSGGTDQMEKFLYMKPSYTTEISMGKSIEIFGFEGLQRTGNSFGTSKSWGINYDNYRGLGIVHSKNISGSIASNFQGAGLNGGLSRTNSTKDGVTLTPRLGIGFMSSIPVLSKVSAGANLSADMSYNTRSGLKSVNFGGSVSGGVKTSAGMIRTGSGQVASSISFGTMTYTPSSPVRMTNSSFTFSGKFTKETLGLAAGSSATGYLAKQGLAVTHEKTEAYGYLNTEKASKRRDVLLDFNREKDGSFSSENKVLAIPINTFDIFSATGHGVGGMFRPFRSDIGMLHDKEAVDNSDANSFSLELGLGQIFKAGANKTSVTFKQRTGGWYKNNELQNVMNSREADEDKDPLYEPSYFKAVGEKTPIDENLIINANLDNPLRPKLLNTAGEITVEQTNLVKEDNGNSTDVAMSGTSGKKSYRNKRDIRNDLMTVRTVSERAFCSQSKIGYYLPPTNPAQVITGVRYELDRSVGVNGNARPYNHITEVKVMNTQGMKYVYGIPAYNNVEYDYAFTNAKDPDGGGAPTIDEDNGEVSYDHTNTIFTDLTGNHTARNYKGNNHFFECSKTPAYAHSYLLTEVQSPDYIENGTNGPRTASSGTFAKIDYYLVKGGQTGTGTAPYKWRVPVKLGKANYNPGYKSVPTDDGANILYGEKEVWLVRSIEGRNHIAFFYISKREDGLGVNGVQGGTDVDQRSYKLDKIELYSKEDLTSPIKTVNFEYDYSLCGNVDNNSTTAVMVGATNINAAKGKLTLKKLYFTYGKSTKGKFNAYEFTYSLSNPAYQTKGYNRWGGYKEKDAVTGAPSNIEFPYVNQDQSKSLTDADAAAWSLTDIKMPSGGTISITYESDDYAYVQDRKAMRMYKIAGFGSTPNKGANNTLFANSLVEPDYIYDYIYFKLPDNKKLSASDFRNDIIGGPGQNFLYFNCFMNLTNTVDNYEYVRGYAEIADAGICDNDATYGWVKVIRNEGHHPIAKTAWQLSKLYMPEKIYSGSNLRLEGSGKQYAMAAIRSILGFAMEAAERLQGGLYNRLENDDYAQKVNLNKSWIRLNDLTGFKFGGGSRVKQIEMKDNWQTMGKTSAKTGTYGQRFEYTTEDTYNGEKRIISSGVASYEPMIGNDENPFRLPVAYTAQNVGVPDDQFYSEEPFGESFFPSAVVGYSIVTVKSILPKNSSGDEINNTRHRIGKVVNEFFTAKDFPTIVKYTGMDPHEFNPSKIFSITKTVDEKYFMGSQGFQVELNDMHGKPKSVANYSEENINSNNIAEAYSGTKYEYQKAGDKRLSSEYPVIDRNNHIFTKQVGVESEVAFDSREMKSQTYVDNMSINVDFFTVATFPVLTIIPFPTEQITINGFKSAVISRVINRYGIQKATTAYQNGATIRTENMLLDAETGAVVLTKTQNEFNDYIYNTNYPVHWTNEYDGMGHAYKNAGAIVTITSSSTFGFAPIVNGAVGSPSDYFADGDEVILNHVKDGVNSIDQKCWVYKRANLSQWMLIDKFGIPVTLAAPPITYKVKIITSGRKNMQSASVGAVTSLASPVVAHSSGIGQMLEQQETSVLNASAVEFSNKWKSHFGDYIESMDECVDVFETYDQYQTQMKNEFRDYLIALIYNKGTIIPTVYNNVPTSQPITISAAEINSTSATRIKQLMESYKNCKGVYPAISCTVSQSATLNNCSQSPYPSTLQMERSLTVNLRIGQLKFALDNYKIAWNGDVASGVANVRCKSTDISCGSTAWETTLSTSTPIGTGVTGIGQIGLTSATVPPLEVTGITPVLKLTYNPSATDVMYNDGSGGLANYDADYFSPYNSSSLSLTNLYFIDPGANNCTDPNPIYLSMNSASYSSSITNTIGALKGGNGIAYVQKDLIFVWDQPTSYPYIYNQTTRSSIDITYSRDPNAPPPCIFEIPNMNINPFTSGIRGNWRPYKNWAYLAKRTSPRNVHTDIRKDGTFVAFNPFWYCNTGNPDNPGYDKIVTSDWVMQNEFTKYSRFGNAIESKDALQRFSAQLVNPITGFQTAVANNAKFTQIAYDDMESYAPDNLEIPQCPTGHFNFIDKNSEFSISKEAHSGMQSMYVDNNHVVDEYRELESAPAATASDVNGYRLTPNDINGQFNPSNGLYVISAWVKVGNQPKVVTYDESAVSGIAIENRVGIQVYVEGSGGSFLIDNPFYPAGPIIEGWQKIEGSFQVDNNAHGGVNRIKVKLVASKRPKPSEYSENPYAYTLFDDLRIQPVNASMKTYVYHPKSLRLMADLDENNYATFYEYDVEGKRVRTKRETDKGVVTLKESRSALIK